MNVLLSAIFKFCTTNQLLKRSKSHIYLGKENCCFVCCITNADFSGCNILGKNNVWKQLETEAYRPVAPFLPIQRTVIFVMKHGQPKYGKNPNRQCCCYMEHYHVVLQVTVSKHVVVNEFDITLTTKRRFTHLHLFRRHRKYISR